MPYSIKTDRDVTNFIKSALNESNADLSKYKDPEFANSLREVALEHIHAILFKIHIAQMNDDATKRIFELKNVINNKHPDTKCTMLDYCLVAGLSDLALRLTALGCDTSVSINTFVKNLNTNFKSESPEVVAVMRETIENMVHGVSYRKTTSNTKKTFGQKLKEALFSNRKFAFLLLFGGIACIVAAPFSGGLSTILFVSIGIPSLLASVPAFQSANNAEKARNQIKEQTRIYYEAKEIRNLLKLVMLTPGNVHADNKVHPTVSPPPETPKSQRLGGKNSIEMKAAARLPNKNSMGMEEPPLIFLTRRSSSSDAELNVALQSVMKMI